MELVRARAADRAGVGRDGAKAQAEPGEDARVGVVHVAVLALEVREVGMERVAVLHQELARAHDPEAGADLVAELDVHLIEVHRQLAIALDLASRDVRDHLLVRRAEQEIALVAVLDLEQLRAECFPAPGFLPQLGGNDAGHLQLERPGAVHLLAHHRLHFAQHAQPERHPGVEAGAEPPDQAGPQH